MNFDYPDKVRTLIQQLADFMQKEVYPIEKQYSDYFETAEHPWRTPPLMETLKAKARAQGLWNLFLPNHESDYGPGLSNLEYAPLAEVMGRVLWAPEIFNCHAPDTGNMETLIRYGTAEHKTTWLTPLLNGEIRSAFAMTEPDVPSSDATNIKCSIVREGDEYVINGRKWFATGAMRESCKLLVLMGKTDPENPDRHRQQSMVLVPKDSAGLTIVRSVTTLGYKEYPIGEPEILLKNVRVPATNILLGEGRGFEVAQGRLGPGRIHHCMRLVGLAQRALEAMCKRVTQRVTFNRKLSESQTIREWVSQSFCDIQQARLLTLMAADKMDKQGNKGAKDLIAAIKIVAPRMAFRVIDRAIQVHGCAGLTGDFFLAEAFNYARQTRFADGPDQVHMMALGKQVINEYAE